MMTRMDYRTHFVIVYHLNEDNLFYDFGHSALETDRLICSFVNFIFPSSFEVV